MQTPAGTRRRGPGRAASPPVSLWASNIGEESAAATDEARLLRRVQVQHTAPTQGSEGRRLSTNRERINEWASAARSSFKRGVESASSFGGSRTVRWQPPCQRKRTSDQLMHSAALARESPAEALARSQATRPNRASPGDDSGVYLRWHAVPVRLAGGQAVNWQGYVTVNPTIAHGKACFKGTGILVSLVLDNLATGQTVSDILTSYSSLTDEAVRTAVVYAVEAGTAPERPGRASSSIQKVCTIVGMREH